VETAYDCKKKITGSTRCIFPSDPAGPLLVCSLGFSSRDASMTESTAAPPLVEVIDVLQRDVPIHYEWIGTADGLVNATIRAQVMGYLIRQNYREGIPSRRAGSFSRSIRAVPGRPGTGKGQPGSGQGQSGTGQAEVTRQERGTRGQGEPCENQASC